IMLAGTLSLNQIVANQSGWLWDWYVFQQPLAFIVFFIAATAEGNRTPFDLTEADSEIVAGFATEYSGMRFGFFFFAEYVNVFILSALTVVLFLGGWNAPFEIDPLLDWIGGVLPGLGITTPVTVALDPGGLGLLLLFLILLVPPLGTLLFAAPFYLLRSSIRWWVALIIVFLLFNVVAGGLVIALAYVRLEWVAGPLWVLRA